jgi:hypothetical protein
MVRYGQYQSLQKASCDASQDSFVKVVSGCFFCCFVPIEHLSVDGV